MSQSSILDAATTTEDETTAVGAAFIYRRLATATVALGHLMLILPVIAAFENYERFTAYYLDSGIATTWAIGLALDLLVVAGLALGHPNKRGWMMVTAGALLVLAILPWLEVHLGAQFDYANRKLLPMPWSSTHLGPVGSATALLGAATAFAAREGEGLPGKVQGVAALIFVLAVQAALYVLIMG